MKNLLGEYVFTPDEIAKSLVESFDTKYSIVIDPSTKMGFNLVVDKGLLKKNSDTVHQRTGLYAIYKDHHCLYTGKS